MLGTDTYKLNFKNLMPAKLVELPMYFVFSSFNLAYNKKVLQYHKQDYGFIIDPFYYSPVIEEKMILFIKELSEKNQTISTKQHQIFILEKGNALLLNQQ